MPDQTCWLPTCPDPPVVQWQRRASIDSGDLAAVHACAAHAITLDAAAHVHQPSCTPDAQTLPLCGCLPEPLPQPEPAPAPAVVTLPTGWTVPVG